MTAFSAQSLRWLKRLLLTPARPAADGAVDSIVLDGVTAIAVTEARMRSGAALGAGYPAAAGARAWNRRRLIEEARDLGRRLTGVDASSPRGALAAAVGMSLSGERATAFVSGAEALAVQDLLAQAAGQHLPLVLHLVCRAASGHAQALGSGHDAYHAASDRGLFQLFATSVQDAVDLALVARRVAERALVPGLVAMDAEQTALAAQDVRLPDEATLTSLVGSASDRIEPPTEPQRLLFGPVRRRVPRVYDLERPTLLAPLQGPEVWGLGVAAARPCFDEPLETILEEAFEAVAGETGRSIGPLLTHRMDDAKIVLLAQGSAVETALAAADRARRDDRTKVGVLGVRCLRPFPGPAIVEAVRGATAVAVLERVDVPLAGDGPLAREVRAALDRARENARARAAQPGYPILREGPRVVGVAYGLGGLPLRATDLRALVDELRAPTRAFVYLGVDFLRSSPDYPKRQVLTDALRRSRPEIAELGLRGAEPPSPAGDERSTTVAIHRLVGREHDTLAGEAATLLHEALGGGLRSRPGLAWSRSDEPVVDRITHASGAGVDPGDDATVDIVVAASTSVHPAMDFTRHATAGTRLLLVAEPTGAEPWSSVPAVQRRRIRARGMVLDVVRSACPEPLDPATWRHELLLGGLLAAVASSRGETLTAKQARTLRTKTLEATSGATTAARLDVFVAGFESLERLEMPDAETAPEAEPADGGVPFAVRHMTRADGTVDCLSRFWDQTGVLYRDGNTAELAADPHLAVGAVPPLSATFRDGGAAAARLPVFDPASCTGDPRLWTTCPEGSIAPLVISARRLLDAGISLASEAGHAAEALGSVASNVARRANRIMAGDEPPTTAGALLTAAFEAVMAKPDTPETRRATLATALDHVVRIVGALPIARTPVFFDEPEQAARGSGELLTLVVNPDAGPSVPLLLAVGATRGLTAVERTPASVAAARRLWDLWCRLPDTAGETIERARTHPDVGPLGAAMLSRHCLLAMTGGDGAEPGSGARLALRNVLALAEFHAGPRLQAHLEQIERLRHRLAERIRAVLAEALPTGDLDALAEGLEVMGRSDIDLAALSARVDTAVEGERVDGARLGRLVDAARELADLQWRLSRGPDGLGRARVGLAIAGDSAAAWTGAFPYNPFAAPVVIDTCGQTSDLARGVLEGQLREVLSGLRLLRWADTELERPEDATRVVRELERLRFDDLTDEERALCPPVIVLGDGRSLGTQGLGPLVWLLGTGLPVKVVILNGIGGGIDGMQVDGPGVDALGPYPDRQPVDLALLAVLARKAFVVQTSIAHPDHFAAGVERALGFDGPALVHVHAPSPERHGFPVARLVDQARLAVDTRAFPLFAFDPTRPGVFGSCLDLQGNPEPAARRMTVESVPRTPASWAMTEARFASHFRAIEPGDPSPTPIEEYLDLTPAERAGRTPFVPAPGASSDRLRVDDPVVVDADERDRLWRTLQELAGVVTPFTEAVREAVEHDVEAGHRADVETLKQSYEAKLAALRAEFAREATQRVTAGLMTLAGYDAREDGDR